ncbi:sensor histidine kinase [Stappia indica]|uniref:sensor histidine kinase n=1 Tax=Stappia indica TaxID=538381 RepID=UPI001CD39C7C|nr:PAS domain-containing sensor histidine kinase [Stappia indica]MCA1297658.1 PAS domain S-box protein [Stappia indica]
MNSHLRNFMALSGLAAANIYLTDRRPAWIWAADGKTILWANAAGAAFFGAHSLAGLADVYGLARAPARPHIARIAATGPADRDSIDRLRFYRGLRVMLLTCTCRRISLPDGDSGALIVANDAPSINAGQTEEPAISLCRLLADDDRAAFLFGSDGTLRHSDGSLPPPEGAERTNLRRAGKHSPVVAPLAIDGTLRDAALLALDDGGELLVVETGTKGARSAPAPAVTGAGMPTPSAAQQEASLPEETTAASITPRIGHDGRPDTFPAPAALGDHAEAKDFLLDAERLPTKQRPTEQREERPLDARPAVPSTGLFALASATRFLSGTAETASPASDTPPLAKDEDLPDMASVLAGISAEKAPEAAAASMAQEALEDVLPCSETATGSGDQTSGDRASEGRASEERPVAETASTPKEIATATTDGALGPTAAMDLDRDSAVQDAATPAPEAPTSASGFVFTPHPRPVRFAWKMDIDQRFTFLSPEFTEALGPEAADVLGLTWTEVAERFQLDPEGGIAASLTRRDTWSGRTVRWPVSGAALKVPVDMAALPAFDRHRVFEGFRGFGVCRTGEATRDPLEIGPGLRLRDTTATVEQPDSATPQQAAPDEAAAIASPAETPASAVLGEEVQINEALTDDVQAPPAEAPVTETPLASTAPEAPAPAPAALPEAAEPQAAPEPIASNAPEDTAEPAPRRSSGAVVSGLSAMAALIAGRAKAARADRLAQERDADGSLAQDAPDTGQASAAEPVAPDAEAAQPEETVIVPQDDGRAADLFSREEITAPAAMEPAAIEDGVPPESAAPPPPTTAPESQTPSAPRSADPALDASRLSKPEREAFRKIAEALGATPEAEDEAPSPSRHAEPVAPAAPAAPAVPAGSIIDLGRRIREAHVPSRGDVPETLKPVDTPQPAKPARDTDGGGTPVQTASTGLLDRLPVGVGIIDGDDVCYANTTLLDLLGYPTLAALRAAGGLSALFAEPEDWPGAPPGSMTERTMRICLADGGTKPVKARLHSVPWQDGKALMVSLLDRHDPAQEAALDRLHEVQTALNIAEEHLSEMDAVLETATDGVLLLNEEGRILKVNRSAEALFGASRDEMIGAALTGYLAPESHRDANDYLEGLARNGVASVLNDGREVIGQVRSGGLIPLFMTIGRVGSNAEGPRFCTVLRDITQWKTAEEELTDAKRQAENASSQKSDFLAKISHEIRTPLNAIIGFSEVMMEERFGPVGNDRYKGYLRDIHNSGSHIMSLINDLLDLSKIEAGKLDLTFEAVSANDIIRECVALMQPQANRERVIIRASLPGSVPSIVADGRSVRQIILNLLSNAIKFNQPGGQVIVSTALEDSGEVILRVRDTGMGMSAKDLGAAMEPFRQLHTARHGGGTGLGLPLTKALVEANRASFRIDSELHQGTLVEITFPPQRVLAE